MTGVLGVLADNRVAVYLGGLGGIGGLRLFVPASPMRALGVALLLGLMTATYAAELWLAADADPARPLLVVPGLAGVVVGVWLVLVGTLPGLLFVAGGLLFLHRGTVGGGRR